MANSLWIQAVFLVAIISCEFASGCVVTVRNNCGYSVTACAQSGNQNIAQYNLGSGGSQGIDLGSACNWQAAAVYASVTGQCAVSGSPNAATDRNLANLAEFTIPGSGGNDFYDISNVNAYTIGLAIRPANGGCRSISCTIGDIRGFCQPNNVLQTLPSGALSCVNTDGTNGLGPTAGTMQFKNACPDAYSYNFDDATSTFTCGTGTDYEVVFCP
ncbi:hypothetical protein MPTK1_2g13870 [Marchantia polymorpha subsp. ruderalis]|uniref:Thaumatin-like protein n=1 Tax=Marchantia polymorpha TaxID=3197 RepID=A0A2R6X1G5_MARPO|nr:hypothetical protein MARPO_0042s0016 [Marchantia polymorpha]BBN02253.1 hypothetical protein Mp_2g13870 [Marchantia polymorpha subsp. ruderalis]|eukprot:PTQ39954.1 hypothetical protein MARPO_0042s0016 [Marchantia polymorpha]